MLTNQLKEVVSYRQLQVMEETFVMNQCKEDMCFVSDDFDRDLRLCRSGGLSREYVLPDFSTTRRGFGREPQSTRDAGEQTLLLRHERFAVPEALFRPSDVGVDEMGLAESAADALLRSSDQDSSHRFSANVLLTGGCANFQGFAPRFENELRALLPDVFDVRVTKPPTAHTDAWAGGAALARHADFAHRLVTKEQYDECGAQLCRQRFDA